MGKQFDRSYLLEVARPGEEGRKWEPPTQVEFSVEQGITSGMDKLSLKIINRDASDVGFLVRDGLKVFLRAGYVSDGIGLIFAGQIAKKGVRSATVVTQEDTRRVISIEAGVGEILLAETRFDRSYAPGVTNLQIIDGIAAALGVQLRERSLIPTITYSGGWVHSGKAGHALRLLARDIRGDWTLQGSDLYMLKPGQATSDSAVVISEATGLIGRVVRQVNGLEFKSRLNRRLRPGRRVVIESDDVSGTYKLTKVTHSGNLRQGPWESACFCQFYGGQQ